MADEEKVKVNPLVLFSTLSFLSSLTDFSFFGDFATSFCADGVGGLLWFGASGVK